MVATYARDDLLEKCRPVMQRWADCIAGTYGTRLRCDSTVGRAAVPRPTVMCGTLHTMTPELYTILGVGIALGGLMLNGQRTLRQDLLGRMDKLGEEIVELRGEVGQLRECMAHLEGLMEDLREAITGPRPAT